jgi:hypothetical protein
LLRALRASTGGRHISAIRSDAVRAVWAALVLSRWLLIPIAPRLVLRVGLRLWLVLSILQILLLIRADVLILAWRGVFHGEAP